MRCYRPKSLDSRTPKLALTLLLLIGCAIITSCNCSKPSPTNAEVRWDWTYIGTAVIVSGKTAELIKANGLSTKQLLGLLHDGDTYLSAHVMLTSTYGIITTQGDWNGLDVDWDSHGRTSKGPSKEELIKMWNAFLMHPSSKDSALILFSRESTNPWRD
jgi:hypothetical protein